MACDREWLSMRNFFAETISTRKQGKLSGNFAVHKVLGCKIIPGTWAITQSIPHLTRNTWLCLTRPWVWVLVLGTTLSWSPWPQQLVHRPSAEAPSLYRNPAMVPRALAKQNHSWQKIKQKIAPEDKNTAGEKFKESKQMKIIIG